MVTSPLFKPIPKEDVIASYKINVTTERRQTYGSKGRQIFTPVISPT